MKKIAIIGSGLASTSVAKSLVKRGVKPIIFDIGRKLDNERQKIIDRMSKLEPGDWNEEDRLIISKNPKLALRKTFQKLFLGQISFMQVQQKHYLSSDEYVAVFSRFRWVKCWLGCVSSTPHDTDLADWPIDSSMLSF